MDGEIEIEISIQTSGHPTFLSDLLYISQWWIGGLGWWFGLLGSLKDCYLGLPLETQTTGPQTTNLPSAE